MGYHLWVFPDLYNVYSANGFLYNSSTELNASEKSDPLFLSSELAQPDLGFQCLFHWAPAIQIKPSSLYPKREICPAVQDAVVCCK